MGLDTLSSSFNEMLSVGISNDINKQIVHYDNCRKYNNQWRARIIKAVKKYNLLPKYIAYNISSFKTL